MFLCRCLCESFDNSSVGSRQLPLPWHGQCRSLSFQVWKSHFNFCPWWYTFQPVTTGVTLPWQETPLGKIHFEMASLWCPLAKYPHLYWLALVGNAFSSQLQSSFLPHKPLPLSQAWLCYCSPLTTKLAKSSLKAALNSLERREYDSLRGVWLLMPSRHRNCPYKIPSQSCSTFHYFIFYCEGPLERDPKSYNQFPIKSLNLI